MALLAGARGHPAVVELGRVPGGGEAFGELLGGPLVAT